LQLARDIDEIGPIDERLCPSDRQHFRLLGDRQPRVQRHARQTRLQTGKIDQDAVLRIVEKQSNAVVRL
jgi:hypothetical protein